MGQRVKSPKIKEGFIYIISNKSFPGFYKIGVTTDIQSRLKTYQTGDPHRKYCIEYYIFHPLCYEAEKRIKEMMKYFSTDTIQRGEWFRININIAKARLDETLIDYEEGLYPKEKYNKLSSGVK